MLLDLKIMSLLVFKPSYDRKATFLSFLLTISVSKALENRKTSRKHAHFKSHKAKDQAVSLHT